LGKNIVLGKYIFLCKSKFVGKKKHIKKIVFFMTFRFYRLDVLLKQNTVDRSKMKNTTVELPK